MLFRLTASSCSCILADLCICMAANGNMMQYFAPGIPFCSSAVVTCIPKRNDILSRWTVSILDTASRFSSSSGIHEISYSHSGQSLTTHHFQLGLPTG